MVVGWAGSHSHDISVKASQSGLEVKIYLKKKFPKSFPLRVRQYRAYCKSKYIRYEYEFNNTILVLFIGQPIPNCTCYNLKKQKKVVEENQNLSSVELYHKFNNVFPSKRHISNLKNSRKRKCVVNRNFKNRNPVDHIQLLLRFAGENKSFVRCHNRVAGDLPSFILAEQSSYYDIFSHIIKGNFCIHVDKTFNICNYHVTPLSYISTKLINFVTKNHPLFLGPNFIHKKRKF